MTIQGGFVDALAAGSGVQTAGASAALLAANPGRVGSQIVLDPAATANVYLPLGAGTASASNWHFALSPGGSWDGTVSGFTWRGAVQCFSSATPLVGVLEL